MTPEHEWDAASERCVHCGTLKALHEAKPQNCTPRWQTETIPRATNSGQSVGDFAADDADVIGARLKELQAERLAAQNEPEGSEDASLL
jgi:hypothetical protein